MDHVITTLRTYLELSRAKLAKMAGLTQPDISEMEHLPPYGRANKYRRLADCLCVTVECLVKNDYRAIPEFFFDRHPAPDYTPAPTDPDHLLGRQGEEFIFRRERDRLQNTWPALSRLVLPLYKMKWPSPGYDILSFDDEGQPICLEIKTSAYATSCFRLTRNELDVARRMTDAGERYVLTYISGWGSAEQQITDTPFGDVLARYQCTPAYYNCVPKPKPKTLTGLAFYRQLRELKQEVLAEQLGLVQCNLSLYENGQRSMPIALYLKASEVLDATVDQLAARYDAPPRGEAV